MNIKDIIINAALANPTATAGTLVALVGAALAICIMVRRGAPFARTANSSTGVPSPAVTVAVVPGTATGSTPSVVITITRRQVPNPINTVTANANARTGPVQITPEDRVVKAAPESLGSRAPDGTHRDIANRMVEQRAIDAQRQREAEEMLPAISQGVTQVKGGQHDGDGYSLEDELLADTAGEVEKEADAGDGGEDDEEEEVGSNAKTNEGVDDLETVFGPLLKREEEGQDGAKQIEDVQKMR